MGPDWSSVAQRRVNRAAPAEGGWNAVTLGRSGVDLVNPLLNASLAYNCRNYPGWFCDPEIDELLKCYSEAGDDAIRHELIDAMQRRFHENVNMVIAGQYSVPHAYRADLKGLPEFAFTVLWNVQRSN